MTWHERCRPSSMVGHAFYILTPGLCRPHLAAGLWLTGWCSEEDMPWQWRETASDWGSRGRSSPGERRGKICSASHNTGGLRF